MKSGTSFLMTCLVTMTLLAPATAAVAADNPPDADYLNAPAEDIQAWRNLKFGLFIHWGPVSLTGKEIGWSRGRPTPVEVYDNLYKKFNPVKFDAHQWVEIAKAAGMRYMVFTTKHHDGFCCFDSKLTDYKITNPDSPYGRDIVKQLADACHQGGIKWGIYYSPVDWHHPDYRTKNHAKYIEYLHGQLRELLSNYGEVSTIFFDGLGGSAADWDTHNLIKMCRRLQPHVIINNRAGLPCDNDTPEQRIGGMQTHRPWETCMTICRQWAWKPNDQMKSLKQCLQTLIQVVGGDGNLLFNVGPMPDGRIEPRQVERLKQMGAWLEKYGQSIYDTRGGPFKRGPWGCATYNGDTVYLHILDPKLDTVTLPPIQRKIITSSVLTGGTATVKQGEGSIEVSVPQPDRQEIDTIVVLKLDGPAAEAKPGRIVSGSAAFGKPATASNVFQRMGSTYGPQMAVDDDIETRWATDGGTRQAWLQVDLEEPKTLDRAVIREAFPGRVQQFELQAREGGQWKKFAAGEKIGENLSLEFTPVAAQEVRLNILEATEGPTIWEFQLFEAKQ